ncbi:MAG: aminotransferase class III [Bacteroides sp. SM23_62_1]|nr:MAG: aminotransferase class III [Bacteroides sp. SM23_62_1]
MISNRQLFLQFVAQTSDMPAMLEIEKAEGIWLFSPDGKKYADLISGVSVSNIGHNNPSVNRAVKHQIDRYMHLMVYGEYIQVPQVQLARLLAENLPVSLNCTYFVNSGSEAVEGAMKLSKRYTGRPEIIAFKNGYHGSTQGALSVLGDESFKNPFRPLIPGVSLLQFNNFDDLNRITEHVACVIVEPIQAEAGVRMPEDGFLNELRNKCRVTGSLLVFDEIQVGFGRTGTLFAFQDYGIEPDILALAKSLGGGLPLGAFIASRELLDVFKTDPALGHITTFGGHPVSCAAGIASLEVLLQKGLIENVREKEQLFRKNLIHPLIKEIRGKGLLLAVELGDTEKTKKMIRKSMDNGIILDSFLFCLTAFRISPPLTITEEEIKEICERLIEIMNVLTE